MNKIYTLLIILVLGCVSCGDFLEEDSQTLSYVTSVDDLDELLVGSGYLQNARGTYYIMSWLDVMDDDVRQKLTSTMPVNGNFNYLRMFFNWASYPWDDDYPNRLGGNKPWARFYECIEIANLILGDIDRFEGEEGYERVKGEAYFIRAFWYFYLVNLWGHPYDATTSNEKLGVPVKLTDYVEVKGFSRNTVEECYQQILSDARQAIHYLKGVTPSTTYRAGENAARALLAKTALYMGDWNTVVNQCDSIFSSPKGLALIDFNTTTLSVYATAGSYNALIRSNSSSEAIFAGGYASSPITQITTVSTFAASEDLLGLYGENDLRYASGKNSYFFQYSSGYYGSYRVNSASKLPGVSLLFSEVYLNKAEALALLGRESEAISTLQELRDKRMSDAGTINETGEDLVEFIRDERRRELCFAGQRWFDLRRYAVHPLYPKKTIITHPYYEWNGSAAVLTKTYVLGEYPEDGGWLMPMPSYALESNDGELEDNVRPER
ncbi:MULTISPECIES: RagB/SusD family nutrient uptake outer membrane protein [Butyricimonas]|uniref:RagB/SusD family nutrient uptake outer membrane protein n=1 Tax=Butyricimonas TaxID=574697 RepID=UPI0007FB48B0|nr:MULTISPECIES: RagB/SusD family nutrient uptake outer membrane protein [Butyricimonas]